jgi:hypothetical protein
MANINPESGTRPNNKYSRRLLLDNEQRTIPRYKGQVQSSSPACCHFRYQKGNKGDVNKEYKSEILGKIEGEMNFTCCCQEQRLQIR